MLRGLEGHRAGFVAILVALVGIVLASPASAFPHDHGEPTRDPVTGEIIISWEPCTSGNTTMLTSGPDAKAFGAKDNCVDGAESADDLNTGKGNDLLWGGSDAGADTLAGRSGNDYVYGEDGGDILKGGPGDDLVRGGNGDDQVSGSGGNDLLVDGPGTDALTGGSGADRFLICRGEDFSQVTDFKKSEGDTRSHAAEAC